ncbi:MAG: Flp pilus assembly complex ATPase component TadA [Candidatus Riflebacteria bacterium]|nr:Flp pilus assembly complex ATPase component TadA [Candidatus Riflebacteria bacterium]
MNQTKRRLGDLLIDCSLITQEQLSQALAYQKSNGVKLGQALIEMGIVTEQDIIWALGNQLNVSFIHLSSEIVDKSVLELVSIEYIKERKIIPLYKSGKQLSICMVDPLDTDVIDMLASQTGFEISISICTNFDFEQTYKALFGDSESVGKVCSEDETEEVPDSHGKAIPKGMESPEKVINYILGQAIINKVEKIHFEPSEKGVVIRFRICSTLVRKLEVPLKLHSEILAKLKTLSQIAPGQTEKSGFSVGHFRVSVSGRSLNVQSIFYPTVNGEMVILSITDSSNLAKTILQSEDENLKKLASFIRSNHGVLYISGPRESGRTTMSYYLLNSYDIEKYKIVTIEDPVHVSFPGMTQIQIGKNSVMSMRQGLDVALRLDADLIYVDYLDDSKTALDIAFASLGGKTVLTSFLAHDVSSSVCKLYDLSEDMVVTATSLCGFLSMRLVRKLCPVCRKPADCDPALIDRMRPFNDSPQPYSPQGCEGCQGTGYSGRKMLFEFLPNSAVLRQMMIQKQNYQAISQFARKNDVESLEDQTLALVAKGETSIDEFQRYF